MKICDFCGTINTDEAMRCSSCGGSVFKYKCNNCGTFLQEDQGYCPKCGIKAGQRARICPQCNTNYFSTACPTCGYLPGKVNNIVSAQQRGMMVCPKCRSTYINVQAVNRIQLKRRRHRVVWWIFVGWWWIIIKWTYLLIPTLIIRMISSKEKIADNTIQSVAVCQNCGYNWKT
ncbi:MAG: zinc ribbon domain-containing protein [Ruminococcus sp.]|nr:zinc ribbon domain-containing protein [Ruminococcus sp.]